MVFTAGCSTLIPYRLASIPAGWERTHADGDNSVAYHNSGGGTLVADASCDQADDIPLNVLTNHLLFGVMNRHELPRTTLQLDGRAALRTQVDGTLDGVRVAFDIVVLKKDGCVFDLYLIAPVDRIAERRPDFERFFAGFSKGKP